MRSLESLLADPRAGRGLGSALIAGLICLVLSIALLASSFMGAKWLLVVIAAFLVGCAGVLAHDRRLYVFSCIAACVPIGIQYRLLSHRNRYYTFQHFGGAPAEPVLGLVDFPIALLGLMWVLDLSRGQRRLPAWNRLDTILALFLLFSVASVISATEHALLAFEILRYAKYLLLYWILRTYIDRPAYVTAFMAVSLMVAAGQGLVALAQYYLGLTLPLAVGGVTGSAYELVGGELIQRVTGLLGHSNTFAAYLLLPIGFALILLVTRIPIRYRLATLPCLALALVALLLTFSRNGLISLALVVVGVGAMALATRRLPRRSVVWTAMTGLLVVLLVFGFGIDLNAIRSWGVGVRGLQSGLLGTVVTRIVHDPGKAVESRMDLLRISAEMVRQNPILGIGLNSFEERMAHFDRRGTVNIIQQPVHNIYLLTAAETGLPSLIAFIALGFMLARRAWRLLWHGDEVRWMAGAAGLCALGALGFSNLFDATMRKEPIIGMLTIISALVVSVLSWSEHSVEPVIQETSL